MLPDLQLVIRLQEIDNRLADLTREIAALPKPNAGDEEAHWRLLSKGRGASEQVDCGRSRKSRDLHHLAISSNKWPPQSPPIWRQIAVPYTNHRTAFSIPAYQPVSGERRHGEGALWAPQNCSAALRGWEDSGAR